MEDHGYAETEVAMLLGFARPSLMISLVGCAGMAAIFEGLLLICIPLMLAGSLEDPTAIAPRPLNLRIAFRETGKDRLFCISRWL